LNAAPVTSASVMFDNEKAEEVDLQRYAAPIHTEAMVTNLSESHLSSLVVKLLCTICNIEIR
jgi:hypothetical protein